MGPGHRKPKAYSQFCPSFSHSQPLPFPPSLQFLEITMPILSYSIGQKRNVYENMVTGKNFNTTVSYSYY